MIASDVTLSQDTVMRLSKPVPRYTSYPSTPHFNNDADGESYGNWLSELNEAATLSLYLHIPFCDRLCWFCACHTKHTLKYAPIRKYLTALLAEIRWVSEKLGGKGKVTSIHLGGGSPSLLKPEDLEELRVALQSGFRIDPDVEVSIEMDPNDLTGEQLDGMAAFGMTRASFGIQDFNPQVQATINRIQTFEQTANCIHAMRERGIGSINLDVLYGLPHQTTETVLDTVAQVLSLAPDRIALFGYAHVPWMKKHQTMIEERVLPGVLERFEQQAAAARLISRSGYESVGFDHFARPHDKLALAARTGKLRRNFQGYTDDRASALIGLGASAIGRFPQGYVQNVTATSVYEAQVLGGRAATSKGHCLSTEDLRRAWLIEELLCRFQVDIDAAADGNPDLLRAFLRDIDVLTNSEARTLLSWNGKTFGLAEQARPFVRHFAAAFDSYLARQTSRHSSAI